MDNQEVSSLIEHLKGHKVWEDNYRDLYDLFENGLMKIEKLPIIFKALMNLTMTSDFIVNQMNQYLKSYGLSIAQKNVLETLYYSKVPVTQVHLSQFIFTSKSNISSLLDRMENKKLIKKYQNPKNKREKLVKITKLGESKLEEVFYSSDIIDDSFDLLTQEEAKELNKLLFKLKKNFDNITKNER